MQENESIIESGYCGSTHDNVRRLIHGAIEEHTERRLGCLSGDGYEEMNLELFEKAHRRAKRNIHAPKLEDMQQATEKYVFTGGARNLLHGNIFKLAKFKCMT